MRRFRRFRLSTAGWVRWAVLTGIGAALFIWTVDLVLFGPLMAVAETEARQRGIQAINRVVMAAVGQNLNHDDLITYEKDQQGRIAAYRINTPLVNQVASKAALARSGGV
jgi:putative Ca2+/H+ antiporter (TMEM165/GDT1 family)